MKIVKKNNHEVPKTMIKRWAVKNKIWLLDLNSQTIEERSVEATFAIEEYLYVPLINEVRNDDVENWLQGGEEKLARFLKRIAKKDIHSPMKRADFNLFTLGLLSLAHRSGYTVSMVIKELEVNEELRKTMGLVESNYHKAAVENLINLINITVQKFSTAKFKVMTNFQKPLLISDRPCIDGTMNDYNFISCPMTPAAAIYGELSIDGPMLNWVEANLANNQLVDNINEFTIAQARSWIVATTRNQLESIRHLVTPEEIKKRISKDKLVFQPMTGEGLRFK